MRKVSTAYGEQTERLSSEAIPSASTPVCNMRDHKSIPEFSSQLHNATNKGTRTQ